MCLLFIRCWRCCFKNLNNSPSTVSYGLCAYFRGPRGALCLHRWNQTVGENVPLSNQAANITLKEGGTRRPHSGEARAGNCQSPRPRQPVGLVQGAEGRTRSVGGSDCGRADTGEPREGSPPVSLELPFWEGACRTQNAGSLRAQGAPSSGVSRDLGRALDVGRNEGLRGSLGLAGEVLGAPSHSRARGRLCTPEGGRFGFGGAPPGIWTGTRAPWVPQDSPFWPFSPQWVPSSWCPDWNSARMWTYEACVSPCEAQSCPAAAAGLFILAAPVWDGVSSLLTVQLPASGREHAHQPFIEACLLLGELPCWDDGRRWWRLFSQMGENSEK